MKSNWMRKQFGEMDEGGWRTWWATANGLKTSGPPP